MPPKQNPLRLNKLQLKTLTLFQELARSPDTSTARGDGSFLLTAIPQAHGNHFHLGEGVVMAADATGLRNESVWRALHRKTLIESSFPSALILTSQGAEYDTGLRETIMHGTDH
ncbi:MAG: hypothetical protein HOK30_23320 [Rhodospirillaceae bacterium]|jgi:hypothetical protein|nr:hypothetical protein [Rhodospirillaceae bacterium]MBT4688580.1 hypothetical protein [Rhodospirillaceae bacterium]MBT5192959.1 hypothetical protein [Rhodospirillaceae bacterium]MBT6430619.1 hypothetical protein [Rhodospirillaceae bacterium]MBT7757788.1 hypothetical protein [Rhodospirillaceae bacterium]